MYVYLAIALLSAALSGVGVWRVQDWRYGAQEAARMTAAKEQQRELARKSDTAAVSHEADKQRIRTVTRTVTKEVERIVREPFYVDRACLNDDGLRQLAAALGTADAPSKPASAVPRPVPAR